jgi:hypothetical protein
LGLDVLSLGIMEYNMIDVMKADPVKQVAIAYDEQDRVRFVSQPWPVIRTGPCRRMRSLVPANFGIPSTVRPSPMAHPVSSASDIAILELDSQIHAIDGRKLEGRVIWKSVVVELPPGHHTVNYSSAVLADVELLPGRLYRVKRERSYPGYQTRVDFVWIEDVDSGEILHCDKSTPPY